MPVQKEQQNPVPPQPILYPQTIQPSFQQPYAQQISTTQPNVTTQPIVTQSENPWVDPKDVSVNEPVLVLLLNFLIPGLGTALMGQVKKGLIHVLLAFLVPFVLMIFAFIPIIGGIIFSFGSMIWVIGWRVITMHDGYVIATRIQRNIPVMKGECGNRFAMLLLSQFMAPLPVFVTGENAPNEWTQAMQRVQAV